MYIEFSGNAKDALRWFSHILSICIRKRMCRVHVYLFRWDTRGSSTRCDVHALYERWRKIDRVFSHSRVLKHTGAIDDFLDVSPQPVHQQFETILTQASLLLSLLKIYKIKFASNKDNKKDNCFVICAQLITKCEQ